MPALTPDSPIPPMRRDIVPVEYGNGVIGLIDEERDDDRMIVLPAGLLPLLEQFDGVRTARDLAALIAGDEEVDLDDLLSLVDALDREGYLESERGEEIQRKRAEAYNAMHVRPAVHAGGAYPADPDELRTFLDSFLDEDTSGAASDPREPVAVIAPHIDFRVGGSCYGPPFNALRAHSAAETYVIFGTAHYESYDYFMIAEKDFDTPLGVVPCDREYIAALRNAVPFEMTREERAHRHEHSIEFEVVMLRHIFPDRPIRIVPILTGGLYEYAEFGKQGAGTDPKLAALYNAISEAARACGRKICVIASGDMSHVGRKFDDTVDARSMLPDVQAFDHEVMETLEAADPERFIETVRRERNRTRICGVAPFYATLRSVRPGSGRIYRYELWDEEERGSAVTFASAVYYA